MRTYYTLISTYYAWVRIFVCGPVTSTEIPGIFSCIIDSNWKTFFVLFFKLSIVTFYFPRYDTHTETLELHLQNNKVRITSDFPSDGERSSACLQDKLENLQVIIENIISLPFIRK